MSYYLYQKKDLTFKFFLHGDDQRSIWKSSSQRNQIYPFVKYTKTLGPKTSFTLKTQLFTVSSYYLLKVRHQPIQCQILSNLLEYFTNNPKIFYLPISLILQLARKLTSLPFEIILFLHSILRNTETKQCYSKKALFSYTKVAQKHTSDKHIYAF